MTQLFLILYGSPSRSVYPLAAAVEGNISVNSSPIRIPGL
jgi:hypothetical protein